MRKIKFYCLSDMDKIQVKEIASTHLNAILAYDPKKKQYLVKDINSSNFQEYIIEFENYNNFDNLYKLITEVIIKSHEQVKNWKLNDEATEEGFGFVSGFDRKTISDDVKLWLYSMTYKTDFSIIHLCSWISLRLLNKHYWENGNKRTAVLTLINLLEIFGYYLSFTNMPQKDIYDRWYNVFLFYLKRCERNDKGQKEDIETIFPDFINEIWCAIYINAKNIV